MSTPGTGSSGSDPSQPAPKTEPDPLLRSIGLELRDTTAREQFRGLRGAVVTSVARNTLASLHLLPGDLIFGVNNQRVQSSNDCAQLLASSSDQPNTTLHILRNGRNLRLTLPTLSRVD